MLGHEALIENDFRSELYLRLIQVQKAVQKFEAENNKKSCEKP